MSVVTLDGLKTLRCLANAVHLAVILLDLVLGFLSLVLAVSLSQVGVAFNAFSI